MTDEEEKEILALMRAARNKARGYADYFGWSSDRDLEELGVLMCFAESLQADNALFFSNLISRGRSNDPPDCEGVNLKGQRIAFEVTELVDGRAISAFKAGQHLDWAEWTKDKFLSGITDRLTAKNKRFPSLKDAPYPGGYIVVLFTDEQMLQRATVKQFLTNHVFGLVENIDRAFLVLSYDPTVDRCPYFELQLHR